MFYISADLQIRMEWPWLQWLPIGARIAFVGMDVS
jgi:hypothetical protein